MSAISNSLISKIALAKEMYILGSSNGKRNTRVDMMLSIQNFDFCVVALIVSSVLQNGKNPKKANGKTKLWHELINILKTFYNNKVMITDLDNLHDLRNSIQHGDTVPSKWDIQRFEKITKDFFDDVCSKIFQNKITFNSISMANILKSSHEKEMLTIAEKYIGNKNYSRALHLIITTAIYHYMLIISNLKLPFGKMHASESTSITIGKRRLSKDIETLSTRLQLTINRLAMGEYYLRTLDLLKKSNASLEYAYDSISKLETKKKVTLDEVEEAKSILHTIILGTEHLITEKFVVNPPVVYGVFVEEITSTSAKIRYGILHHLSLEKCQLRFYENETMKKMKKIIKIQKKGGTQTYEISDLEPKTDYFCRLYVIQEGDPEYKGNKSANWVDFNFKTKN